MHTVLWTYLPTSKMPHDCLTTMSVLLQFVIFNPWKVLSPVNSLFLKSFVISRGLLYHLVRHDAWQSGKLLKRTYHRRSTYRYAEARIELVKCANWYVVPRIKSVFLKLALLLRVWQRNFFTKLKRRVKQRNSPFRENFTV